MRHVQCTYPNLSWLFVLVAACSLAACGGSIGGDSVTGSPVSLSASEPELESTFEQAKGGGKHHRRHHDRDDDDDDGERDDDDDDGERDDDDGERDDDDDDGENEDARCPCFSGADITAAAWTCSSTNLRSSCNIGEGQAFLLLSCVRVDPVPPSELGIYVSQTAGVGSCSREDVTGTVTQIGLGAAEYQACVDTLVLSRYCP